MSSNLRVQSDILSFRNLSGPLICLTNRLLSADKSVYASVISVHLRVMELRVVTDKSFPCETVAASVIDAASLQSLRSRCWAVHNAACRRQILSHTFRRLRDTISSVQILLQSWKKRPSSRVFRCFFKRLRGYLFGGSISQWAIFVIAPSLINITTMRAAVMIGSIAQQSLIWTWTSKLATWNHHASMPATAVTTFRLSVCPSVCTPVRLSNSGTPSGSFFKFGPKKSTWTHGWTD